MMGVEDHYDDVEEDTIAWPEARSVNERLFKDALTTRRPVVRSKPRSPQRTAPEEKEKDDDDYDDDDFGDVGEEKYIVAASKAKKSRDAKQKRFLWEQKLRQLAHRGQIVENEKRASAYNSSNASRGEILELEKLDAVSATEFRASRSEMLDKLASVKWAVRKMSSHIDLMGHGDRYLDKLKELMETAEGEISAFKRQNRPRFEKLLADEIRLTQEIDAFHDKFRRGLARSSRGVNVSKQASKKSAKAPSKTVSSRLTSHARPMSSSAKKTIEDIDAEIADNGGSNGGWDPRDHATFLRLVSRNRVTPAQLRRIDAGAAIADMPNVGAVVKSALDDIPAQMERNVVSHIRWYARYTCLLARKKEAVKEWKQQRNAMEHRGQAHRARKMESSQKRTDEESKARKAVHRERWRSDQKEKKRAVDEWKREKEARARLEEERQEIARKEKHEAYMRQTQKRQAQKDAIARHKIEKEAMRAHREAKERRETEILKQRRRVTTKATREEMRIRDMDYVKRKKELLRRKREKETRREKILEAYKTSSTRIRDAPKARSNPSRLTGDTVASKAQRLSEAELERLAERRIVQGAHESVVPSTGRISAGSKSYGIGIGSNVGGRAMPSWRKGL